LCSVLASFIVVERLIALRTGRVLPRGMRDALVAGQIPENGEMGSVAGRIVAFFHDPTSDAEQLKAYARLQLSGMERGLFILDIVVAAAPLLGLLGTVTGLVEVFAQISPETGMPEMGAFREGVALALTTTMLGLAIAIPALAFNSYLGRRIEAYAAQLEVSVERLVNAKKKSPRGRLG
ncbi:MAG: MotA/TolQ/ExbB proton channel family protein, partial [Opitutales bacterium]